MKQTTGTSYRPALRPGQRQDTPAGATAAVATFAMAICLGIVVSGGAAARQTCDSAARTAAREIGVPLNVLKAITRSETGRGRSGRLESWPWTVNMEGVGKWFDTRDDALSYVREKYRTGARSFDVGCFQINYKWHGAQFSSITEMFEPRANALYAARFLKKLHAEKGDWFAAAGAYHSRTRKFATRYRKRFERIFRKLPKPGDQRVPEGQTPRFSGERADSRTAMITDRLNSYPLLQPGDGTARFGSLVPLGKGAGRPGLFSDNDGGAQE